MYPKIFRTVILPLGEVFQGTNIGSHLQFLERSQRWSLTQLRSWQQKRMQALLRHAYEKVPFYNKLFISRGLVPEDIRGIEDLQKLPAISKDDILADKHQFVARDINRRKVVFRSTGGTTGKPLQYFQDVDAWCMGNACTWRGWISSGYNPGDKMVTLAGSSLVPDKKAPLKKRLFWFMQRNFHLSAAHMSDEIMYHYANALRQQKPKYIRGYPSALYLFAKYLRSKGLDSIYPKAIFTTAEMLTPTNRKLIEEVFRCKIYDGYGCGDGGGNAMECSEHNGYHFAMERAILEIVKNGKLCDKGETGEFLLTDLHNFAMPFIRYRVGDLGAWASKPCQCGLGLPLLSRIEGRVSDQMIFEGGISLSGPATTLIFQRSQFKQYQLVQKSAVHLLVRAIPGYEGIDADERDKKHALSTLRSHLGDHIMIDWEFVSGIPTPPSGKLLFFISELNSDESGK